MADAKKAKAPTFTTPTGTFKYPKLVTPDTKFKEDGEFSVKLVLTADEAAPLIAKLKPLHKEADLAGREGYKAIPKATIAKANAKKKGSGDYTINPFYSEVYDDNGEPTGDIEFKFAMPHKVKSKKTGKTFLLSPKLFDAAGKPTKADPWSGTRGKIAFSARPYFIAGQFAAGLKLGLEAAQIIELKQGGERNADGYGFGQEEGFTDTADTEGFPGDDDAPTEGAEDGAPEGDGADF